MSSSNTKIRLNIWENIQDPNHIMILYGYQTPTGNESDSASRDWRVYYTFLAYNPLVPPYPAGSELFLARHSTKYPYELLEVKSIRDNYNVDDPGTYFVAYTAPYKGMTKIPFKDTYVYVESGTFVKNYILDNK